MSMIPQLDIDPERTRKLLVEFVKNEISRTGLGNAVVGLSGGIDSALAAFIVAEALGPEHLHCVLMPYRTSSPDSISHAGLVLAKLGCTSETVDISPMADAYIESNPDMDKVRCGNVMARMRMIVLYDRSARLGALVVGTSNKTEIMLGYSTLFGDSAYAINPIGDLYKTQVRMLSRSMGVPEEIIVKPPSADLWEGQSDEADLGFAYDDADRLLHYMIDERKSDVELTELGFDPDFTARVRRRMVSQHYKRRMPVIAKVTNRTLNADYRYARDWDT